MREIILTRGGYAQVDDEDYERVARYRWYLHTSGYAARDEGSTVRGERRTILMHRFILDAPDGTEVDHINWRRADNQRHNMRICTHAQNMANRRKNRRSQFKGVVRRTGFRRFHAEIAGQHLGSFDTAVEAAHAYDSAALAKYGEFAALNFPHETPLPCRVVLRQPVRCEPALRQPPQVTRAARRTATRQLLRAQPFSFAEAGIPLIYGFSSQLRYAQHLSTAA